MDSEGLLLLSNESGLNDRLLNPKNAHERTYLVQVEGIPSAESLEKLRSGSITIQNHRCLPCRAKLPDPQPQILPRDPPIRVRKSIPDVWIEVSLVEGKNRQVRRMTAAIGHPTLRLVRVAIGNFSLERQEPGEWREIGRSEKTLIGI